MNGHEPGCLLNEQQPHHEDTCTCGGTPFAFYEPRTKVLVECQGYERMPLDDFEVVNVEEDMQGRDVVTFFCTFCDSDHKSVVLIT